MRTVLLTLVTVASFNTHSQIAAQPEPMKPDHPIPVGPWFFYPDSHRLHSQLVDSDYRAKTNGSKTNALGAPILVPSMYLSFGRLDSARICLGCEMAAFPERFPGAAFSMDRYRETLVRKLEVAGQKTAYSVSTGSEVIITTHPEPDPPVAPRQYYQVRFLASNCAAQPALDPCRLWGQAIKIKVENIAGIETSRETSPDSLTHALEEQLRGFVADILGEVNTAAGKRDKVKQ